MNREPITVNPEPLASIYTRHQTDGARGWGDKGTVHSYIPVYETLLAPYRRKGIQMLEVGVAEGMSLRMWMEYFNEGDVWGVDLNSTPFPGCNLTPLAEEMNQRLCFFNACDRGEADRNFAGRQFHVIIEDANHTLEAQKCIWLNLSRYLAQGGLYVIEDVAQLPELMLWLRRSIPARYIEVFDLRAKKARFDDVLVVIRTQHPAPSTQD
jgi:hypothetical protein